MNNLGAWTEGVLTFSPQLANADIRVRFRTNGNDLDVEWHFVDLLTIPANSGGQGSSSAVVVTNLPQGYTGSLVNIPFINGSNGQVNVLLANFDLNTFGADNSTDVDFPAFALTMKYIQE